ncbi:hypothetical protein [Nonomuraea sp. SBT364]|uniref:hypothetical protein n=1 Tax=Nonomuraea sp. SBT364 TaxID=1580530 RepID=UPI0012E26589|nr:hypothetical protein [Nonomuraea sp. SBT364]
MLPAIPSDGAHAIYMARGMPLATPSDRLVEDTFYVTEGIEVARQLLPVEKGVAFRAAAELAPGIGVDAGGRLYGTPDRAGTYAGRVQLCAGQSCTEERVTFVVLRNVPWDAGVLTFPGSAGRPLTGQIEIKGGPSGVLPTVSVTDYETLPDGVSIGPDGNIGGVPKVAGVSRVPVRICVAGNCAGVVVTLIVV